MTGKGSLMGLREDLARAKAGRPQPVLVDVAVDDVLYRVEVRRLDGMEWAAVMAEAPPKAQGDARLGYEASRAALVACKRHGRLLDADGTPQDMDVVLDDNGHVVEDPWADVFSAISGVEIQAVAATWWALNMGDPNNRVVDLKKALRGGVKTK